MINVKESELKNGMMVMWREESGIRMNYMVLARLQIKVATFIGLNTRMVT